MYKQWARDEGRRRVSGVCRHVSPRRFRRCKVRFKPRAKLDEQRARKDYAGENQNERESLLTRTRVAISAASANLYKIKKYNYVIFFSKQIYKIICNSL